MLEVLPAFSERFHLSPDEFWGLRRDEFAAYHSALQAPSDDLRGVADG